MGTGGNNSNGFNHGLIGWMRSGMAMELRRQLCDWMVGFAVARKASTTRLQGANAQSPNPKTDNTNRNAMSDSLSDILTHFVEAVECKVLDHYPAMKGNAFALKADGYRLCAHVCEELGRFDVAEIFYAKFENAVIEGDPGAYLDKPAPKGVIL